MRVASFALVALPSLVRCHALWVPMETRVAPTAALATNLDDFVSSITTIPSMYATDAPVFEVELRDAQARAVPPPAAPPAPPAPPVAPPAPPAPAVPPVAPGAGNPVVNPNAPIITAPTQAAYITTMWMQTVLDSGVTTYVEVIYTQAFASVPSQGLAPASGSIGLGDYTGTVGAIETGKVAQKQKSTGVSVSMSIRGLGVAVILGVAGFVGGCLVVV